PIAVLCRHGDTGGPHRRLPNAGLALDQQSRRKAVDRSEEISHDRELLIASHNFPCERPHSHVSPDDATRHARRSTAALRAGLVSRSNRGAMPDGAFMEPVVATG